MPQQVRPRPIPSGSPTGQGARPPILYLNIDSKEEKRAQPQVRELNEEEGSSDRNISNSITSKRYGTRDMSPIPSRVTPCQHMLTSIDSTVAIYSTNVYAFSAQPDLMSFSVRFASHNLSSIGLVLNP